MTGGSKPLTDGGIDGLVRLLADEDEKIRRIARETLDAAGERAIAIVRDRARSAEDLRVRKAAEAFLGDAQRKDVLGLWSDLAAQSDPDLQGGAVLIVRSEYPAADLRPCIASLDEYAEVLRKRTAALRSPAAVVEKLNGLLFRELGYRGNREAYYDPQNSYLNRVVDRKLGIPITLSVICLLVARRIGLALEGVGMPGHFLLRYRVGRKSVFLDPFNQGRELGLQDCMAYLETEGFSFREEYLKTVKDREILLRILENLLRIYHSADDKERVDRITRMIAALRGPEGEAVGPDPTAGGQI